MNVGIIVFAYNRNQHLQKVLDGLSKNKGVSRLYIFQDGLKCDAHRTGWEKTKQVIKGIDWCEVVYNQSLYNKGLAKSVVDGINIVFKENDAVIVLEDDCVPTANYISFMYQCFEKYRDDKRVFAATGYCDPVELPHSEYDIYGCGICPCWGWGTWKDRWGHYKIDADILKRINSDKNESRYLATWGEILKPMLVDRILGVNDSWAVYWGLSIIENNGICINPYESLIQNIGMDGTGVHCGATDKFEVKLSDGLKYDFKMPDKLEILSTTEEAFINVYGNYTALNTDNIAKESVLVYGLGNFYKTYEKELNGLYYIESFIDRRLTGWYAGKKIIHLDEVSNNNFYKIIIMIMDVNECINCINRLIDKGIKAEDIVLGHSLFGKYSEVIDRITILPEGALSLVIGGVCVKVKSGREFDKVYKIFVEKECTYLINNKKRDIVLNVGRDIGCTTLYFAVQNNVDRVCAYEISGRMDLTYADGIGQNMVSDKVTICEADTMEVPRMIKNIVNNNPENNIILNIEYINENKDVLGQLLRNGALEKMKFIMIEVCDKSEDNLIFDYLKEAQFSWCCYNENRTSYLINAYKC